MFPETFRFEDGETLTFHPVSPTEAEVKTSIPSRASGCTHFGFIGVNSQGKWSGGWNGVARHEHDSLEEALHCWRRCWHHRG